MRITILGASGFLGKSLTQAALTQTDWIIRATARDSRKLESIGTPSDRLELQSADVLDYGSLLSALSGTDVAYYFVHLMGHKERDFYEAELEAAHTFVKAANASSVKRIVYVGGLGDNAKSSSRHLRGRHETGEILRNGFENIIELRASMIIGDGSVGYDIIRSVANKFPAMVMPKVAGTVTQPIGLKDTLDYLLKSATISIGHTIVVDIGGPEVLSYADVYRKYSSHIGKHPIVLPLPFVTPALAGVFLDFVTPKIHARIGRIMFESMAYEMTVKNDSAKRYFPTISPEPIERSFD